MRSVTVWVVTGVGLLALTGCSGASPDDAYVAAVEEKVPGVLDHGSREDLVKLGHTICSSLDAGVSSYDLADGFLDLGWTMAESGTVVVQAAKVLCPEHEEAVS